jgi:hypothetical protein
MVPSLPRKVANMLVHRKEWISAFVQILQGKSS